MPQVISVYRLVLARSANTELLLRNERRGAAITCNTYIKYVKHYSLSHRLSRTVTLTAHQKDLVRFTTQGRASVPSILGSHGDNKVNTDLGVVSAGKGENKNEVDVAVPIHVLSSKAPQTESKPDPATQQEDYYKTFRTDVLLVWTLSNVSDHLFDSELYRAIS
jgi:hypothetical protein